MTINKNSYFVRHKALNLITLISFLIDDSLLKKREKEVILKNLKLLGLIISEEDMILGKKGKNLGQRFSLNQAFEVVNFLVEKKSMEKGIKLNFPDTDIELYLDKNIVISGLEYILLHLMNLSKKIELSLKKNRTLNIEYEAEKVVEFNKEKLIDVLREDSCSDIFFQIGVCLMNMNGIRTNFKKGLVEINF